MHYVIDAVWAIEWVIECMTVPVAQWLSTGFSHERPGLDITAGRPVDVLKSNREVSSAFVTTRANGWISFFFMVFTVF